RPAGRNAHWRVGEYRGFLRSGQPPRPSTLPSPADAVHFAPQETEFVMKVICDRGALLDAVNLVSGVVAARTPRPQLQCVKLTAQKTGKASELALAATDAEVSLRLRTAQVDVQE